MRQKAYENISFSRAHFLRLTFLFHICCVFLCFPETYLFWDVVYFFKKNLTTTTHHPSYTPSPQSKFFPHCPSITTRTKKKANLNQPLSVINLKLRDALFSFNAPSFFSGAITAPHNALFGQGHAGSSGVCQGQNLPGSLRFNLAQNNLRLNTIHATKFEWKTNDTWLQRQKVFCVKPYLIFSFKLWRV